MAISGDPAKRAPTPAERGLDSADAGRVFEGLEYTQEDTRFAYPERRFQTCGLLDERLVMVVRAGDRGRARHLDKDMR